MTVIGKEDSLLNLPGSVEEPLAEWIDCGRVIRVQLVRRRGVQGVY